MANYSELSIEGTLRDVCRYMGNVEEYRQNLQKQKIIWDYLAVLGGLAKVNTELTRTREEFNELANRLLNHLSLETLNKVSLELSFKAQVAVDIMVRNLFERTADIGFLATDADIREFLQAGKAATALQQQNLLKRFEAYVANYSVYHNVILLDLNGHVLAQLDDANPVTHSNDPLIATSIATDDAFVETFRHSDLVPEAPVSLIYSYRVLSADMTKPLGVIALCFRFENECQGIFDKLSSPADSNIVGLLDTHNYVIASNSNCIPVGLRMDVDVSQQYAITRHERQHYLAYVRNTQGYQGYTGKNWRGFAMVPLEMAFRKSTATIATDAISTLLPAIVESRTLFDDQIMNILAQANRIQRQLNRSVWNGNVQQNMHQDADAIAVSKVLLGEIKNTGIQTKQVFEDSISDIEYLIISSMLLNSEMLASLAIDVMDRNLYERANDCRWWAHTTAFRTLLEKKTLHQDDIEEISNILKYINGLYTVYSNLIVFNKESRVIAVSCPDQQQLAGQFLEEEWVERTLRISSPQEYVVSQFEKTALYNERPTYIYATAIWGGDKKKVIGGVGIVFDAAAQFKAMLEDAMPRHADNSVFLNSFNLYADRQGKIIASTHHQLLPGQHISLDEEFLSLRQGESTSKILQFMDAHYLVGGCISSGYREYKSAADTYQNDVLALVFIYMCSCEAALLTSQSSLVHQEVELRQGLRTSVENETIATFYLGQSWLGLQSHHVTAAIGKQDIVPIREETSFITGYLLYQGESLPIADARRLFGGKKRNTDQIEEMIVIGDDEFRIALIVDALGEVLDIARNRIHPAPQEMHSCSTYVKSLIQPENPESEDEMLQLLDMPLLLDTIRNIGPV